MIVNIYVFFLHFDLKNINTQLRLITIKYSKYIFYHNY